MFGMMLLVNPYEFGGLSKQDLGVFFISLVMLSAIIPMIAIMMMYGLGMVRDIELSYHKDRIGPFIVTGTCYCWLLINFYKSGFVPETLTSFMLGTVLALFISFLINLFQKISLHAVGISGLMTGVIYLLIQSGYVHFHLHVGESVYQINMIFIIVALLVITGLVCTSRLVLRAHIPQEIYGGLFVGILTQIIALRIL